MKTLYLFLFAAWAAVAQTSTAPMPAPEVQYLDKAGRPLAKGKLCTYAAGTSTPLATYIDSTGSTPNTNPVTLDSAGRASLWGLRQVLYKLVLRSGGTDYPDPDACTTGTVLWTQDNVPVSPTIDWVTQVSAKPFIDVRQYGADPTGVSDSTSAIQAALTAGAGGRVYVPQGTFKVSSPLNISGSLLLDCASVGATFLTTSATANMLVFTTSANTQRVRVNNCHFSASVTRTAGDAIQINGSGGVPNYGAVLDGITMDGQYNGIHLASASHYSILNTLILAGQHYDIWLQNSIAGDSGDSSIIACILDNSDNTKGAGIRWESGGGLKVLSTKILNHTFGIDLRVANAVSTSDMLFSNNSLENAAEAEISIDQMGTTGAVQSILITGNQMAGVRFGVATGSYGGVGGIANIIISGNLIGAGDKAVLIGNTAGAKVANNKLVAPYGVYFGTGNSGQLTAEENQLVAATAPYVGTALFLDHLNALTYAQITAAGIGPVNGSQVFCANCDATCSAGSGTGRTCVRENGVWTH